VLNKVTRNEGTCGHRLMVKGDPKEEELSCSYLILAICSAQDMIGRKALKVTKNGVAKPRGLRSACYVHPQNMYY